MFRITRQIIRELLFITIPMYFKLHELISHQFMILIISLTYSTYQIISIIAKIVLFSGKNVNRGDDDDFHVPWNALTVYRDTDRSPHYIVVPKQSTHSLYTHYIKIHKPYKCRHDAHTFNLRKGIVFQTIWIWLVDVTSCRSTTISVQL